MNRTALGFVGFRGIRGIARAQAAQRHFAPCATLRNSHRRSDAPLLRAGRRWTGRGRDRRGAIILTVLRSRDAVLRKARDEGASRHPEDPRGARLIAATEPQGLHDPLALDRLLLG